MNRTYVIINYYKERDIFTNILDKIERNLENTYYVFYKNMPEIDLSKYSDIKFVKIDNAVVESRSATKNFVSKYLIEHNTKGFVHVLEDNVEFFGDFETQTKFNNAIENFLSTFKINVWFNTITDVCNLIFNKFNPRFTIKMDATKYQSKFSNDIIWASHSSTSYIIYNMDNITIEEMLFEEKFKIPMFYILEFLARKRASGKGFMNLYPTVPEEKGVFRKLDNCEMNQTAFKSFNEEENIFKSMNINMQADMNVDKIFEFIENSLKGE